MIAPLQESDADPDAKLMERVRDGESELFGDLARCYQSRVAGIIKRMQPHSIDVDDLTQRVFIQAFRARNTYRPTARFSTWLYVITRNVVLNERRTLARRKETRLGFPMASIDGSDSSANPVEEAIRAETREQVERAIRMLNHRQRVVIELVFMKGHRYGSAAKALNISEKAVKSLVHRAKGNLKTHLNARFGTPAIQDGVEDRH